MSRKRKEPLGPFAGVDRLTTAQGLPRNTLGVQGVKATLHDDTSGSISSAVQQALLRLGSDEENLVDRFDARLLLDNVSLVTPVRPAASAASAEQELEEELDEERYADLDYDQEATTDAISASSPAAATGAAAQQQDSYQAVSLSYDGESPPETVSVHHGGEHFDPGFDVPTEHQHALRGMTDQQHKVMLQTARFLRQEGDQLELVLRVRLGQNASFAFLKPGNPLHDYYRWLVHAEPQARESTEEQQGTAKESEQQQELGEAGNALSQLVSHYAASQDGSHDEDNDSASPRERAHDVNTPWHDGDSAFKPGTSKAGKEPEKELSARNQSQPPADDSAAGEGIPMAAGGPAQPGDPSAQRTQQAPAEVRGIVAKLMAFVKKSGVKFQTSIQKREKDNPRFGFLHPGHAYHGYYREQVLETLGKEKAEELFARIPAQAQASAGEAVLPVVIRSNPSLAKIPFARRQTPLLKAAPLGSDAEAAAEQVQTYAAPKMVGLHEPDAADTSVTAAKGTGQESSEDSSDSSESRADRGGSQESGGLSDAFMEGDAKQHAQRASSALAKAFASGKGLDAAMQTAAEADALEAEEALKAERRRLAMQLLAARRSEAEKTAREDHSAPTAQAIARHRLALLAEASTLESGSQGEEPEEEAEAGEITAAKPERRLSGAAEVRVASLPRLEEVIRVPPPKTAPSSSDSSSSSSSSSDREKSRREEASPESRNTLEGPGKQRSRRRNRSPGSAHDQSGSPEKHYSSRRSNGRYAERSKERAAASHKRRRRDVRLRSPDAEFRSDSSDDDRRHRHETLSRGKDSKKWQERPKSLAKEGTHRRDGHRHKRHKHKMEASTKEELRSSHSRRTEEQKAIEAAPKKKRKSEKRHDWGITQTKKVKTSAPPKEDQTYSVSASEVPDALRARIKDMLSQS